jgi:hypothetical protein
VKPVDKDKLKKEIKRVEKAIASNEGQFTRDELKQYLKMQSQIVQNCNIFHLVNLY